MLEIEINILRALRKLYGKTFGSFSAPPLKKEMDPDKASDMIYELLSNDKPCMIARYGANELNAVVNYLGVKQEKHSPCKFIKGEMPEWWWNQGIMRQMESNAGFFPSNPETLSRFGELMLEDTKQLDLLGSWMSNEYYLKDRFTNAKMVHLRLLEPFWSKIPWTRVLKGKKVLVVHPFADTIKKQYEKRNLLFEHKDILPDFASLEIVKAIQSLGGAKNGFKDWFEALHCMEQEIDDHDYDICLIGCGAYGFPLAAHVKRQGKKAVHLGGALQLLFGIKGKRWENPNYGVERWGIPYASYSSLMNRFWTNPEASEHTVNAKQVEGGCYW